MFVKYKLKTIIHRVFCAVKPPKVIITPSYSSWRRCGSRQVAPIEQFFDSSKKYIVSKVSWPCTLIVLLPLE